MPYQYFLLDSNATGYAAALTALKTYTDAKVSFTTTQTIRDCSHDSTLKIVKANITEAELDADSDLAPLRTANYSTELCRTRYTTLDEFRVRGFHVLGESVRSNEGAASRNHYYIRRKTRQSTGTSAGPGYGESTGLTHYDARDGMGDAQFAAGHSYTACGIHIRERVFVTTGSHAAENMDFFPTGDSSSTPVVLRMDHNLDPGILACGYQDYNYDGSAGGRNWVQDGGDPDVWSRIGGSDGAGRRAICITDATATTTNLLTVNSLIEAADETDVRATPWSWWWDSGTNTTWVNIPGAIDPRFKIGWTGFGTSPGFDLKSAICHTTASQGFEFINCQVLNAGDLGQPDAGPINRKLPKAKFLGGRWLLRSSFFPEGMVDGTEWGWSTDGEILFDTSDRPDPVTDTRIAKAKAKATAAGADSSGWANFDRFIEIAAVAQGIYHESAGLGLSGSNSIVRGCYQWGIGRYVDADRNISFIPGNPGKPDGHCIGLQGIDGWQVSYVYFDKNAGAGGVEDSSKTAISYYSTTDSTGAQNLRNHLIEHFVSIGYGIDLIGDGGSYLRTGGSGLYDGNIIRYGCITDVIEDTTGTLFSGLYGGSTAIGMAYHGPNTELLVNYVHFVDCYHIYSGQGVGDMCLGSGGVSNPEHGYLLGNSLALTNCTFEETTGRIIHSRHVNFHATLKTISAITNASPAVATVTSHGFPDFTTPAGGVIRHPYIYLSGLTGGTWSTLDDEVVEARWVDANSFQLYDLAGNPIDGTSLGTFSSGGCQRAQTGYIRFEDNTIIQTGADADTTLYRYGAGANQSLNGMQALGGSLEQHLPGCSSASYETGTVINP